MYLWIVLEQDGLHAWAEPDGVLGVPLHTQTFRENTSTKLGLPVIDGN
jgi:hypothetical protein